MRGEEPVDGDGPREVLGARPSRAPTGGRIDGKQLFDSVGEGPAAACRDDSAARCDKLRKRAAVVDDHRGTARHRLQRRQAERLHRPGSEYRVRGGQQAGQTVPVRHVTEEDDREAARAPGEPPPARTVTGDHQAGGHPAADELRQRVHGGIRPFFRRQPADVDQEHLAVTGERPTQRAVVTAGVETIEIDAQRDLAQVRRADADELGPGPRGGGDHRVKGPGKRAVGPVSRGTDRQHSAQRTRRPQVQQPVKALMADDERAHAGTAGPAAQRPQRGPVVHLDAVGRRGVKMPDDPPWVGQDTVVRARHQRCAHGHHPSLGSVTDAVPLPGQDLDDLMTGRGVAGGEMAHGRADTTGPRRDEVGGLNDFHRMLPSS